MGIRELIAQHAARMRDADTLSPDEAARRLVECTSLLSSLNVEIAQSEHAFKVKKLELLGSSKSAAETKIRAEATDEYRDYRARELAGESLLEIIRSLKTFIKRAEDERKSQ